MKREPPPPPQAAGLGARAAATRRSSTCFAGIPSDRIWFPSDRGDRTSFFQYINPRTPGWESGMRRRRRRAAAGRGLRGRRAPVLRRRGAAGPRPSGAPSLARPLPPANLHFWGKTGRLQEGLERRAFPPRLAAAAGCCWLTAADWLLLTGCCVSAELE